MKLILGIVGAVVGFVAGYVVSVLLWGPSAIAMLGCATLGAWLLSRAAQRFEDSRNHSH